METTVLSIDSPGHLEAALQRATTLLKNGEIVAIPTETVYGLAANALDANAVRQIYEVKKRPARNPIIVHVNSLKMAQMAASSWPAAATVLGGKFWPGPLSLVLPKARLIPDIVTAGGNTVGVRWPRHPFIQRLIDRCGFPLAAPSANLANQISPTIAAHVLQDLGGRISLIVDAGPSSVGIESTVLDLTSEPPRVLRPGIISTSQLELALGIKLLAAVAPDSVLKSPGLMAKHYSPRAPLKVISWTDDEELRRAVQKCGVPASRIHLLVHDKIPEANPFGRIAIIPHDPEAYARALYAELHQCDELAAELILVEGVPPTPEWEGIRDRLNRASAEL
jgi:L-threonylcarbamoyladenylate synthase